jgi:hypothetical protein
MSTMAKGDAFEERVHSWVTGALANDRIGLSPKLSRVFRKKAYHSRDRGADIIVDVSIEVWLPDAKTWSLIWVYECKDYSGSLPVNDVEEFKAKLNQIAGVNCKGALVTTGALQRAAFNYAKANGIAVLTMLPDDRVRHVLEFKLKGDAAEERRVNSAEFIEAHTNPHFVGRGRDFYASYDQRLFEHLGQFLAYTLREDSFK